MSDPKFQRGDLVRHRASGEVAVVVDHGSRCTKHAGEGDRYAHVMGYREDCVFEFNGTYDLNLGFERDAVTVEEYLLERVETAPMSDEELGEFVDDCLRPKAEPGKPQGEDAP